MNLSLISYSVTVNTLACGARDPSSTLGRVKFLSMVISIKGGCNFDCEII